MLHEDTITVFNRYESKLGDMWYATVIPGCHVRMDKAAIQAKYGAESADSVVVMVPCTITDDVRTVAGKTWLPPKEWDGQTNDLLTDTVTFTAGNDFDFFLVGEWDGDAVIDDEGYVTAKDSGFYSYLSRTRDNVFAITSVGVYRLIPHFELTGK